MAQGRGRWAWWAVPSREQPVPSLSRRRRGLRQPLPHERARARGGGGGGGGACAACGGAPAARPAAAAAATAATGTAGTRRRSRRKPGAPRGVASLCRQHSTACQTWTCGCPPGRAPTHWGRGAARDAQPPPQAVPGPAVLLLVAAGTWRRRADRPRPGHTAPAWAASGPRAARTLIPQAPRGRPTRWAWPWCTQAWGLDAAARQPPGRCSGQWAGLISCQLCPHVWAAPPPCSDEAYS